LIVMTRQEAMDRLRSLIPSFNREYFRWGKPVDKNEDDSWLYRDEHEWDDNNNLITYPKVIPGDYMVGISATLDGEELVTVNRDAHFGRRVALDIVDYENFGNKHKYGTLRICGVMWKKVSTGSYIMSSSLSKVEPHAKTNWEVNLYKIIAPEDLSQKENYGEWSAYNPNEATQRFDDFSELYCTAAYVSLLRVGGPFYLYVGETYVVPQDDDYLLIVDENDDVKFCERLNHAIEKMG